MIKKTMTCIQCPQGCQMSVMTDDGEGRLIEFSGNQCPKGEDYARAEIENPLRILTSAVFVRIPDQPDWPRMLPVKTSGPIPKSKLLEVMDEIKKTRITQPAKIGEVIVKNISDLKVNLIATRNIP